MSEERTALHWEIFTAGWEAPCAPTCKKKNNGIRHMVKEEDTNTYH